MHIGDQSVPELDVQISEVQPVRKLFVGRSLQCYSLDCRTGKNSQLCEVCSNRLRCRQRLQLRLVYNDGERDQPAILELASHSFSAFDQCLEEIGSLEVLPQAIITIKPVLNEDGWTTFHFQLRF